MLLTKKSALKEHLFKELDMACPPLPLYLKSYLADLLCLYLPSDQLFEKKEGQTKCHERTLADMYKKSQSIGPGEKLSLFKRMGDLSLYVSGFFRAAVKRKIVHLSYYERMGQSAYHFASSACPSKPNVFKELSQEFKSLSQILFCVQKKSERQNPKYLLDCAKTPSSPFKGKLKIFH